jgi:UTP--glucose-1-phosphate uridylyltransferase
MRQVLFITGPGKVSIENHFDLNDELVRVLRESGKEELLAELEYERAAVQYFYTRQRKLLGLGHAVSCAEAFVGGQPFVVALGDSIIGMHAQSDIVHRMKGVFVERRAAAVIAFEEVPKSEVSHYGIASPGKTEGDVFEIRDLIEKPTQAEAPSTLAIAARYVFAPGVFQAIRRIQPGKGGELQITDAIRLMIQEGGAVYGMKLRDDERRYDIGNFQAYFRAFVEFALADRTQGAALRGYLEKVLHDHHS